MTRYDQTYARWQHDPAGWWVAAAQGIAWDRRRRAPSIPSWAPMADGSRAGG